MRENIYIQYIHTYIHTELSLGQAKQKYGFIANGEINGISQKSSSNIFFNELWYYHEVFQEIAAFFSGSCEHGWVPQNLQLWQQTQGCSFCGRHCARILWIVLSMQVAWKPWLEGWHSQAWPWKFVYPSTTRIVICRFGFLCCHLCHIFSILTPFVGDLLCEQLWIIKEVN